MIFLFLIIFLALGIVLGLKAPSFLKGKMPMLRKLEKTDTAHSLDNFYKEGTQLDPDILEKKMLYDHELSLLAKVGQELSGSVKVREISKIVVENAQKAVNAEKCVLLLLDPDTETLQVEYSFGLSDDEARNTRIKKEESISGWVANTNDMLVVKDIDADYWIKIMNKEKYYTKSLVSIPLSIKSRVYGVLNVNNKTTTKEFSGDDLRLLKEMASHAAVAIQNARLYEQLEEGYFRTIRALASALDAKDPYTARHSENVTKYAVVIARELRMTDFEIENIRRAGLLHDIGKISIPDSILLKPEKLSLQEYETIKTHAAKGQEIIGSLAFLKDVALYVRHHHEKFDGTGYPDGAKGYQIELPARILAVSDAFDTMVSNRPYRAALGVKEASEELRKNSSTQFDSEIVNIFLNAIEERPDLVVKEVK